jgi:hypothetical protein
MEKVESRHEIVDHMNNNHDATADGMDYYTGQINYEIACLN